MPTNDKFAALNLPRETIDKMRRLKIAVAYSTGRIVSYAGLIDELIASLERSNPVLFNTYLNVSAGGEDGIL